MLPVFAMRTIRLVFYLDFLLLPLIFFPGTSEIFEFNKMVFVYVSTVLITAAWVLRCTFERKIIFRRTILDVPLLVFLVFQFFSVLDSIDPRTSLLGYYGRFNGGLFSLIAYCLLYWAFVSNADRADTIRSIKLLLISGLIISIWGFFEHIGISPTCIITRGQFTNSCLAQDVQHRVFATLGQPNWMATFLVALMPLAWSSIINEFSIRRIFKILLFYSFTLLLFTALLFTKSRSGLLGFVAADAIFWIFIFLKFKQRFLKEFLILNSSFLILFTIVAFPVSPAKPDPALQDSIQYPVSTPPAAEGGTESFEIRRIVWKGAIEIWKKYPLLGSGPETFAFAFQANRPNELNITSEWDYTYNKAHNEFLNYLANTGILGLISYLFLVITSVIVFVKRLKFPINSQIRKFLNSKLTGDWKLATGDLQIALLSGYLSILVTNFFGFSTVSTNFLLFLFPAVATTLTIKEEVTSSKSKKILPNKYCLIIPISFVLLLTSYFLLLTYRYWYSDILFAKGKSYSQTQDYKEAIESLSEAISLNPREALYWNELANTMANLGAFELAVSQSEEAVRLSPKNLNVVTTSAFVFTKSQAVDENGLEKARTKIEDSITLSPNHPKLYYLLGMTAIRLGENEAAKEALEKSISLRPVYKEARFLAGLLYAKLGEKDKAREHFSYILEKIDPSDELVTEELNKLR